MALKLLWFTFALSSVQGLFVAASTTADPPYVTVTHEGSPVGTIKELNGIRNYISYPPDKKTDNAILYLPDAYGLDLLQNQLLVDSMARAGYLVFMPDYFRGNPAPLNMTGFNLTAWVNTHPTSIVDPLIDASIKYMRTELGVKNIGAAGYCFGGRFVARFLAAGKGVKAGFTAHPSLVSTSEWQGVAGPISIAAAETDGIYPAAKRRESEDLLQKTGVPYQFALYGGTQHGFGVRVNLKDAKQKYGKESAFYQAIRWFDEWVKK